MVTCGRHGQMDTMDCGQVLASFSGVGKDTHADTFVTLSFSCSKW